MDCKSGVEEDGFEEETTRDGGGTTSVGAGETFEGRVDEFVVAVNGLSSSSSFGMTAAATACFGEVTLGALEDKGLSSSSSGSGFTLATFGDETTIGVLGKEEMGTSSSSAVEDTLTGAIFGEVAFRGDVTLSPFIGGDSSQLKNED
jgi:hypothetical protein